MSAVMEEANEVASDPAKDAHIALEAWARWARSALSSMGWASTSILSRIIELGVRGASQSGPMVVEIDELCELVDRAILRLDKTQREVVTRTYLCNDAAPITARKCGLTYGYYRVVLSDSVRRVGDYIAGHRDRV